MSPSVCLEGVRVEAVSSQFAAMGLSRFVVAAISLMITITSSTVASVIDVNAVSSSTQRNDVSTSSRNDDAGRSDVSASRNDDAGSPDHFRPVQMLPECPAEHYFSSSLQACQPCSKCSDNLIIRRPCSALGDIVCGPFVEFSKFQQSSVLKSDVSRHGHHKGGEHHGEGRHENRAPDGSEVVPSLDAVSVMESQRQWRRLAITVFVLLALVSIIVIVFIFVICQQKRQQMAKQYGEPVLMRPGTVTLPTTMYSEPRYVAFPVKPCPKPSLHSSVHVYEEIADPATFFHGGHVTQDYDTTPFLDACHVAKDAESFHDEGLSRHTSAGVRADDFICDHAVSVS